MRMHEICGGVKKTAYEKTALELESVAKYAIIANNPMNLRENFNLSIDNGNENTFAFAFLPNH